MNSAISSKALHILSWLMAVCRICCLLDNILGDATEAVKFTTLVGEPDQPLPPRLQSKTKTSLQLKWNVRGSAVISLCAVTSNLACEESLYKYCVRAVHCLIVGIPL